MSDANAQVPQGYELVEADVEHPSRGIRGDLLRSHDSNVYVMRSQGGFVGVPQLWARGVDLGSHEPPD